MASKGLLVAVLGIYVGVLPCCIALQCYSWRDSNDALPVSCDLGCASVTLKGWNRITTKQLSLSIGMCNDGACNTTCNRALKLVRNFDLKECNASCCNHDLCNTNSTSPNPTEQRAVQTQAKPRMTRKTEDKSTGLKCYKCEEGKDFHDCNNEEDIDYCGPEHNSCFSITGTLSRDSSDVITHRGCGLEMIDCNITQLCIDTRNKLSVNHGLEMKTCTAYCCRGPFCNKYIPTRPADDDITTIVTTRARRTVKRSQSSSMKCYECKPDTFESLCTTNVTEKACVTGSGGYDGCFTMTATITNATSGQLVSDGQWKGCAVRDDDCNANSSRCDTLDQILKERGLHLKKCLINCCHGDLCNGFLPTAGPNLTMYAISQAQARFSPYKTIILTSIIALFSYWH